MKKLLAIPVIVGSSLLWTGCDVDADLEGGRMIVIDNIYVEPDGWKRYTVDDQFDHLYADIPLPELSSYIFDRGFFYTYLRTEDNQTLVQEGEGITKSKWRYEDGRRIEYTETVSCSYSVGNLRIEISRSDFFNREPDATMYFRTVISYHP